jgi:site-specific recombinase XerD
VDLAERTIDFTPTKRGRKRLMAIKEDLYYVLARRKAAAQGMTGPNRTDRVFSRPDGPPWSKGSVEDHFGKAPADAGITKPLVWHDLRHTVASRMKRNGVHEPEIQRLLGHKTLAMTDRYINVELEQMRAAVATLVRGRRAHGMTEDCRPCRNMTEQTEVGNTLSGKYSE